MGLAILLIGVLMLLNNLGIFHIHDVWSLWPILLIGGGLGKLFGGPRRILPGIVLIAVGTLFLLQNFRVIHIDASLIIPSVLIALGLMFLLRSVHPSLWVQDRPPVGPSAGIPVESAINAWAVFSGVKRRIDTQSFTGGEILAVFGGVDLDLRRASIQGDQAVIDANATFGGVEIRVPETWSVNVRGLGLFGGYEDHTVHPPPNGAGESAKRLIVTGYAVFGGVEIRN